MTRSGQSCAPPDFIALRGGAFTMGSDHHYAEEAPARRVEVAPFRLARHPVTNAEFARFVAETGYVTLAERPPDPTLYPDLPEDKRVPGSAVFRMTEGPVPLDDARRWWVWTPGAAWRSPDGLGGIEDRMDHPVVHIAREDALAYARHVGARLPTEAEWEFAARGGLDGADFAWGDEFAPDGVFMANTWQGAFPYQNLALDGFAGTSPVDAFPANPFGLFDMIGNVWELTADAWRAARPGTACCTHKPAGDPDTFVMKGGSHLCAPDYCRRYRPAARHPQAADATTSHAGFRLAASD
jgi:formylglycine-generating enzyme required for sulfatase activity